MRIRITFTGLNLLVRQWPTGSKTNQPSEKDPHPVTIYGVFGGSGKIPLHNSFLTMPLAQVQTREVDPDEVVCTPNGQIGVWSLKGRTLSISHNAPTAGVLFRDRIRPSGLESPAPNIPGDWEDIAWVADLERVVGGKLALKGASELEKATSYRFTLDAGRLRTRPPRRPDDRYSVFRFDPVVNASYVQSFSDSVVYTLVAGTVALVLNDGSESKRIVFDGSEDDINISSLSTSADGDIDRIEHFAAYYDLVTGAGQRPIPVRDKIDLQSVEAEGELTVDPFFCLKAMMNQEV